MSIGVGVDGSVGVGVFGLSHMAERKETIDNGVSDLGRGDVASPKGSKAVIGKSGCASFCASFEFFRKRQ